MGEVFKKLRKICIFVQCCGSWIRHPFDPWTRVKIRIRIRDEQHGSYFRELRKQFFGLKYLNSLMRIRDPGWKKSDPVSGMEKSRILYTAFVKTEGPT
jgi:hypothetical protein